MNLLLSLWEIWEKSPWSQIQFLLLYKVTQLFYTIKKAWQNILNDLNSIKNYVHYVSRQKYAITLSSQKPIRNVVVIFLVRLVTRCILDLATCQF